jgi:hypothetical protein
VSDFHNAVREHVLEEPAKQLHGVEGRGSWACTSRLTVNEGDGVVCETHEATVGNGDPEDRGGEIGEGRGAMWMDLAMDIPGDGPDLWGDVLQQAGLAHLFFEAGAGDGGEGLHGDKEGGAGGAPGRAVL